MLTRTEAVYIRTYCQTLKFKRLGHGWNLCLESLKGKVHLVDLDVSGSVI